MDLKSSDWMEGVNPQIHHVWLGRWKPATIEPMRWLIDHELVLFCKGTCEVDIGDAQLACAPGTFLIVPPGVPHVTRSGPKSVLRFCVHFDWTISLPPPPARLWSFSPEMHDTSLLRPAPRFIPRTILRGAYEPGGEIELLMSKIHRYWHSGRSSDQLLCRPLLLEMLLRLFVQPSSTVSPIPSQDVAVMVRNVLDGLPQSDHAPSIVQTLESLGFSYAYLCRRFTSRYGISPLRYVVHARMEKAKALAREGNMKVFAIAAHLGYEDVGYFIRTFRKYTGLTPREFAYSDRAIRKAE